METNFPVLYCFFPRERSFAPPLIPLEPREDDAFGRVSAANGASFSGSHPGAGLAMHTSRKVPDPHAVDPRVTRLRKRKVESIAEAEGNGETTTEGPPLEM